MTAFNNVSMAPSPDPAEPGQLPEEYTSPTAPQSFIVCGFYTPNYLPQVLSLKHSLDAHGIGHFLKRYERRATWEETTRIKPMFLGECLKRFPDKDILYLDADAVVRQPLDFFGQVTADVSLLLSPKRKHNRNFLRLSSGTILVRNTPGGRRFVETWKGAEPQCTKLNHDEDMLHLVFPKLAGISIALLPTSYSKIFDEQGEDTAIEHFQASRTQFKPSYAARRAKRAGLALAAAAAVATLAWMALNVLG